MEDQIQATKIITQADELYDAVKYNQLYDLLYRYKDVENDEILWRLTRSAYQKSKLVTANGEKEQLLKDAEKYIQKALELNEGNHNVHKWTSIIMVKVAAMQGTKAKIEKSLASREHILRAHALNPNDATTLYLLGIWCFGCADLSWTQRKLAGIFIASLPTSTFEEALEYFRKAEEAEPNFYSKNLLWLGKTLLKIKKNDDAINYLKRARDNPLKTIDD